MHTREELMGYSREWMKSAYKDYLVRQDFSANTVATAASDAFYIWRKRGKEVFWEVIFSDDFEAVGQKLLLQLLNQFSRGNIELNLNTYMSQLRQVHKFIHSELAYGAMPQSSSPATRGMDPVKSPGLAKPLISPSQGAHPESAMPFIFIMDEEPDTPPAGQVWEGTPRPSTFAVDRSPSLQPIRYPQEEMPLSPAFFAKEELPLPSSNRLGLHVSIPSAKQLEVYLQNWETLEVLKEQEAALEKLFSRFCPDNRLFSDVMLKVATLSALYGSYKLEVYSTARYFMTLNLEQRIKAGDLSLIEDMRRGQKKGQDHYSFATKYCSLHNNHDFPVYSEQVDKVLRFFNEKERFTKQNTLNMRKDYHTFTYVLRDFRSYYGLVRYSLKSIDKYLWQLGREGVGD